MLYKNDIADLIKFGLATIFVIVFFGALLYSIIKLAKMEITNPSADISIIISALVRRDPAPAQTAGEAQVTTPDAVKKEPIKMVFVGDVMLARGVAYMVNKYGSDDDAFPFLKIKDTLSGADVVFGNLEGPVSDKGYKAGSIYSFEADPKAIDGLTFAGFNVMSCANNHMLDYTSAALEDTIARLKGASILCAGAGANAAEALAPKFLDVKGNKIAVLAYADFAVESWYATETGPGIAKPTDENIKTGIDAAREQGADIVVVSFHFGNEYEAAPSDEQKHLSHLAIDGGADLVIGHHPHVIQPTEEYKPGKWIAYSLGNFVFDQNFSAATMEGGMLEVSTESGAVAGATEKRVTINNRYQPGPAE